jgi:membrane protease YdiL (CAAX protease family)
MAAMEASMKTFFGAFTSLLKQICEGNYDATDAVLRYSDREKNVPGVSDLAETVGLMSVKLEAREMALKRTIEELEGTLLLRRQFSTFFILFTLFIVSYCLASAYLNVLFPAGELLDRALLWICIGFMLLMTAMSVSCICIQGLPFRSFGLTLKGSWRAIKESLIATFAVIILITLARLWCVFRVASFAGEPVFEFSVILNRAFWIYLVMAFGQEFLARGVFQSVIEGLLGGRRSKLWAVVLATMIFAVTHTFYTFWLSVASIGGGLMWGWLYLRHRTVIGIGLSHFIVGNYLWVTGFWYRLL